MCPGIAVCLSGSNRFFPLMRPEPEKLFNLFVIPMFFQLGFSF
jgi:hypothetical protein